MDRVELLPEQEASQVPTTAELSMEQQPAALLAENSVEKLEEDVLEDNTGEELAENGFTECEVEWQSGKELLKESISEHQGMDLTLPDEQNAANSELVEQQVTNPSLEDVMPVIKTALTKSSPSILPSSRFVRAEIDTAPPFESVREAVTLFGERMEWKAHYQRTPSMERQTVLQTELHKVLEDLASSKEQLVNTRNSTDCILAQLEKTRKLIQELTGRQEDNQISDSDRTVEVSQEAGLASVRENGMNPKSVLQAVRKEIEILRIELHSLADSKEAAQKHSKDMVSTWTNLMQRIEELTPELTAVKEALAAATVAHVEAEEQIATLREASMEANMVPVVTKSDQEEESVEQKSTELSRLKSRLEEASSMVDKLKKEILEVKESEERITLQGAEAEGNLTKVKSDLEQTKVTESESIAAMGRVCSDIDDVKAHLKQASDEIPSLSSKMEALKAQLEKEKVELESAQQREGSACATLSSLQAELVKVREELVLALAGEAKAKELMETLPTAIKVAASQADELKAASEALKEEVRKARHEAEEAKAATSTAQSRLQAALKEVEAARVSEAMAIAEFKAVTESESKAAAPVSETDGGVSVTITLEEFSSLNQTAQEAEEIAHKRVVVAWDQVSAAKASHLEAQKRLEVVNKEIESCKLAMETALKKAEIAQSAKLTAEAELRNWRAEQRRKASNTPSPSGRLSMATAQSPQSRPDNGRELSKFGVQHKELLPSIHERKALPLDSLSQVLSLKVPPPEKPGNPPPEKPGKMQSVENLSKVKTKKKTFLSRMASYVMGRKHQDLK